MEKKINQCIAMLEHGENNLFKLFHLNCEHQHIFIRTHLKESKWMHYGNKLYLDMHEPYSDYLNKNYLENIGVFINHAKYQGNYVLFDYSGSDSIFHEIIILKMDNGIQMDELKKEVMNTKKKQINNEKEKLFEFTKDLNNCKHEIKRSGLENDKKALEQIDYLNEMIRVTAENINKLKKEYNNF